MHNDNELYKQNILPGLSGSSWSISCFFSYFCFSRGASENVYSMIQHPKDTVRPESAVPGANGNMSSPRPTQGQPVHGMRAASPPCPIQRQVRWIEMSLQTSSSWDTYYLWWAGDWVEYPWRCTSLLSLENKLFCNRMLQQQVAEVTGKERASIIILVLSKILLAEV